MENISFVDMMKIIGNLTLLNFKDNTNSRPPKTEEKENSRSCCCVYFSSSFE